MADDKIGKKVLLGNFWNFHREDLNRRYRIAETNFIKNNPGLEEWERIQFKIDQYEYYEVLKRVDKYVEAAFTRKRGRMRQVVDDAIVTLADALRVFEDSLF